MPSLSQNLIGPKTARIATVISAIAAVVAVLVALPQNSADLVASVKTIDCHLPASIEKNLAQTRDRLRAYHDNLYGRSDDFSSVFSRHYEDVALTHQLSALCALGAEHLERSTRSTSDHKLDDVSPPDNTQIPRRRTDNPTKLFIEDCADTAERVAERVTQASVLAFIDANNQILTEISDQLKEPFSSVPDYFSMPELHSSSCTSVMLLNKGGTPAHDVTLMVPSKSFIQYRRSNGEVIFGRDSTTVSVGTVLPNESIEFDVFNNAPPSLWMDPTKKWSLSHRDGIGRVEYFPSLGLPWSHLAKWWPAYAFTLWPIFITFVLGPTFRRKVSTQSQGASPSRNLDGRENGGTKMGPNHI